jgi:D-amino-acid dehydrogenase
MMKTNIQPSVAVIGAGIIGVCSALELQKRGFKVTLVEAQYPAAGASAGNCGLLAVGSVVPFSTPGTFKKVPGWLLDPQGPLAIRPTYLPKLLPWFFHFMMAAKPSRVKKISEGLAALTEKAADAYLPWLEAAGISDIVKPYETIKVYDKKSEFHEDLPSLNMERGLGFDYELISSEQLRDLEPNIASDFACAVLLKGWYYVSDPERLVNELYNYFLTKGGNLITGEVTKINRDEHKANSIDVQGYGKLAADHFVLAAGAWSKKLAGQLGDKMPVEALAGYATTVADPGIELRHPITYAAGGFVVTPMEGGLRIGGTIEMGGLDSKPNYKRAKVIAQKTKRIFPSIKSIEGTEWIGYRSFMPDTLPVIDRASACPNVVYAFGHGQIGLTTGAITGQLVAQMVAQEPTSIDIQPYSARRF